jgi:outer membrane lipoprotein-sorting protein
MKIVVFSAICLTAFFSVTFMSAAEVMSETDRAKLLLKAHQEHFSRIQSLSYTARYEAIYPSKLAKRLDIVSKGDLYKFDFKQITNGTEVLQAGGSFNGEVLQIINKKKSLLKIKNGWEENLSAVWGMDHFVRPFDYVPMSLAQSPKKHYLVLRVGDYVTADLSVNYLSKLKKLKKEEKSSLGYNCWSFTVVGYIFGEEAEIKVFVSEDHNYYPIAWERFSGQGDERRGFIYEISELGVWKNGKDSIFYPQKAKLIQYCRGQKEPCAEGNISISQLEINKIIDDELFTIDPSTASYIVDVDNDKVIVVPR